MRRATRPLDPNANRTANDAVAKKYCPQPKPGDPEYGQFREDWMNAYAEAGGKTEQMSKGQVREQVAKDREAARKNQGQRGAVARCPVDDPGKGGGRGKPASPPPPPPAKKDPACSCKLTGLDVTCEHGRSARNNLLMIVANDKRLPDDTVQAEAIWDTISIQPQASGNCGSVLEVRVDGARGFPKKGSGRSSFDFRGTAMAGGNVFRLWNADPVTTFVSAEAGAGATEPVKIVAYPSSKAAIKINITDLREKYKGILAYLPINLGAAREPLKPLNAPKAPNWELKKFVQVLSAEAQWKEDEDTNLAFCEMALNGGFDPLIGTAASYPIYGIPVSPTMARYIKCGIYVNVGLGISLGAACSWAYWPHEDAFRWKQIKIELAGKISVEIAGEFLVASEDVAQIKAWGKAEGSIKGWGEKKASGAYPAVKGQAEVNPLTVGFTITLAWGIVEYERSWPVFKTFQTKEIGHDFND